MSASSMTPKQAAAALVAAMPIGVSVQQLEEYGIEATTEQAQAITQEVLSLNLFWILAAIEAHIPQKYQSALLELILETLEAGWGTTVSCGPALRGRAPDAQRDPAAGSAYSSCQFHHW